MKTLRESLLDDFDTIEKKSDIDIYLQELYKNFNNKSEKRGYDIFGRPLKVGDVVLVNYIGYPLPGLIVDINQKKDCAVSIRGDIEFLTIIRGPLKGSISDGSYRKSFELLKIDEKILKMLYNIK